MTQAINDALLDKLLYMSRLSLSAQERRKMKRELSQMTQWLHKLQEVDTQGIKPMLSMTAETNRLREDIPQAPLPLERVMHNAPDRSSHYFQTPTVKKGE